MTKLQSVAKFNPIKLKISLECNCILNITERKKESNSKIIKTERKMFRMGGFFPGDFFPRGQFSREIFSGRNRSPGEFFKEGGGFLELVIIFIIDDFTACIHISNISFNTKSFTCNHYHWYCYYLFVYIAHKFSICVLILTDVS